jgi:hypothetical protein
MSFEETLRQIIREEVARLEPKVAERVVGLLRDQPVAVASAGDRLLRPGQAGADFGYSPDTILKWMRQGKLKRHGTIRGARVSERELRRYLATALAAKNGDAPDELDDDKILELAKEKAVRGR